MDAEASILDPCTFGRVEDFLDHLRDHGFTVTVDQHQAVVDLLALLLAERSVESFEGLLGYLAPIVCCTPDEKKRLPKCFDDWKRTRALPLERTPSAPDAASAVELQLHSTLEEGRQGLSVSKWIAFVTAGGAPLLITFSTLYQNAGPSSRPEAPASLGRSIISGSFQTYLAVLLSLYLAWSLWSRRRAKALLLERETVSEKRKVDPIIVEPGDTRVHDIEVVDRVARHLRRRRRVTTAELDTEATVLRTVEKAGLFAPVFRVRGEQPEYLILKDSLSLVDQQAALFEELLSGLEERNVLTTVYTFAEDPRQCQGPEAGTPPTSYQELKTMFPEHRLIVMSEGIKFFDPLTGALFPWLSWKCPDDSRPLLMTPRARWQWGNREQALLEHFDLIPASTEGLLEFLSGRGNASILPSERFRSAFPSQLRFRPDRWVERAEPPAEAIDGLLTSLRVYLGPFGFTWLCATAVYPELHLELTIHLGRKLLLFSRERLADLVALPWFRHGSMPDWLRRGLVMELGGDERRRVRAILRNLFLESRGVSRSSLELWVSSDLDKPLRFFTASLIGQEAKSAPPGSPLRDYVFVRFMAGRDTGLLSLDLPRHLRSLFHVSVSTFALDGEEELSRRSWRLARWCFATTTVGSVVLTVLGRFLSNIDGTLLLLAGAAGLASLTSAALGFAFRSGQYRILGAMAGQIVGALTVGTQYGILSGLLWWLALGTLGLRAGFRWRPGFWSRARFAAFISGGLILGMNAASVLWRFRELSEVLVAIQVYVALLVTPIALVSMPRIAPSWKLGCAICGTLPVVLSFLLDAREVSQTFQSVNLLLMFFMASVLLIFFRSERQNSQRNRRSSPTLTVTA